MTPNYNLRFDLLLSSLESESAAYEVRWNQLNEQWRSAVLAEYKGKSKDFGTIRTSLAARNPDMDQQILDRFRPESERLRIAHNGLADGIKSELYELAPLIAPEKTEDEVLIDVVYSTTWSTQGFGCFRYAEAAAQALVDRCNLYGIEARIDDSERRKPQRSRYGHDLGSRTYKVFAKTGRLGQGAVWYGPHPSLRESVRLCWARGTNPRVNMPYLPYGYEEKEGLDFFGNDLRKTPDPQISVGAVLR